MVEADILAVGGQSTQRGRGLPSPTYLDYCRIPFQRQRDNTDKEKANAGDGDRVVEAISSQQARVDRACGDQP